MRIDIKGGEALRQKLAETSIPKSAIAKALCAAFDATFGAKEVARQERIDLVLRIYGASGLPKEKAATFVDAVQQRIGSYRLLGNQRRIWLILLQAIACGRMRIEEYCQMLNEAPELLVAIAEGMGLDSLDQLQRRVADSEVTSAVMIDAMITSA